MSGLTERVRALGRAPHGRRDLVPGAAAGLFAVAAAVGLIAHLRTPTRSWVLGVSAFAPYLMFGSVLSAVLLLLGRRWMMALVAAVLVVVCVSTQVRLFVSASAPPGSAPRLVTMTANVKLGTADPASVVRAVRDHHVQLLMVEELTEGERQALKAAGLDAVLPHNVVDARASAAGTGMWSSYPFDQPQRRADFTFAFVYAKLTVPRARSPLVGALHLSGPVPSTSLWLRDNARLPGILRTFAGAGPVVVGGDFNATPDVGQFRAALVAGYSDAAQQAGAGITRTYPADAWYPPLIAIDHVLTHDAVAISADTVEITGSDHRALLTTVVLPAG